MYPDGSSSPIQAHMAAPVDETPMPTGPQKQHLTTVTRPNIDNTSSPSNTPILRLPHEILQSIFALCLPSPAKSSASHAPSPQCVPLVLTQICSSFRSLALSTPELWVDLTIRTPKDVGRAEKWLKRTGGYRALNVAYDCCLEGSFDIARIANRIGRFDVWLEEDQVERLFVESGSSFGFLNDLFITIPKPSASSAFYGFRPHSQTLGSLTSLPPSPYLRRLSLTLPFVLGPSLSYLADLFPWSQLTYLSVTSLHYSAITPLLTLCTSIREAHIELYTPNAMAREIESPVLEACDYKVLEHLQSLTIIADHFLRLNILDGLLVPNLRSLSLVYKKNEGEDQGAPPIEWNPWAHTPTSYEHFFSQLKNLEHFNIFQNVPSTRVLELLGYMPELEELRLVVYRQTEVDRMLEGLILGTQSVAPKLRTLELASPLDNLKEVENARMRAVVASRSGVLENVKSGQCTLQNAEMERVMQ